MFTAGKLAPWLGGKCTMAMVVLFLVIEAWSQAVSAPRRGADRLRIRPEKPSFAGAQARYECQASAHDAVLREDRFVSVTEMYCWETGPGLRLSQDATLPRKVGINAPAVCTSAPPFSIRPSYTAIRR